MGREKIPYLSIKHLFADSGNVCAFPGCKQELFVGRTLIGEVCHIEGLKPKSARHNSYNSDPNDYDNLIVLCSNHHKIIDNEPEKYTVEMLQEWKREHAEASKNSHFRMSKEMWEEIERQYKSFYEDIRDLDPWGAKELKISYDLFNDSDEAIINQLQEDFTKLYKEINFTFEYANECAREKNLKYSVLPFESACLGIPNLCQIIELHIACLRIRVVKRMLVEEPDNAVLKEKLVQTEQEFKEIYSKAYHYD